MEPQQQHALKIHSPKHKQGNNRGGGGHLLGLRSIQVGSLAQVSSEHASLLEDLPVWFSNGHPQRGGKDGVNSENKTTQRMFQKYGLLLGFLSVWFFLGELRFGNRVKREYLAVTDVAQMKHHPATERCRFSFRSGHIPGLQGLSPSSGIHERQPDASLSHPCSFLSFPLSVKSNEKCPQARI